MTPGHAIIENVSRRGFLKGTIATGSLVVAGQFLPVRSALAYATGADKMPHGVRADPHLFVSIAPDGTVTCDAEPRNRAQVLWAPARFWRTGCRGQRFARTAA